MYVRQRYFLAHYNRQTCITQNPQCNDINILVHLILELALLRLVCGVSLSLDLILERDIQITVIPCVWCAGEDAVDLLAFVDGQGLRGVEDGLLPMRVLGMRTGAELDLFVGAFERDIEPRKEGMNIIIPGRSQAEGDLKGQVFLLASQQVDVLDGIGVCHDRLKLNRIDKRLTQRDFFYTRIVEAVDVVPEVNLLVFIFFIFDSSKIYSGSVREDHSSRFQVLVAGNEDGIEHRLVQKEVAHPFADDDIEFFDGEVDFFEFALDEGDGVRKAIGLDNFLCLVNDVGHVDANNVLRTGLSSKHTQNTCTTSNIQHSLVLEQMGVVDHGITVRPRPNTVLQHLFMDAYKTPHFSVHIPLPKKDDPQDPPTEMGIRICIA